MSDDGHQRPGLSWPDHDTGPTPPPGYGDPRERATRRPLAWWDRVKILLLLGGSYMFLVWGILAADPSLVFAEAMWIASHDYRWLLWLIGLEAVRQVHYLISERSAGYHHLWSNRIFGGLERRASRMDDWNRYRIARVAKWLFVLAVADLVLARTTDTSPSTALFQLPLALWNILPMALRLLFGMFFLIVQFAALFWFLSKGGIDTYMPEDIKTRFSDVWGQDHVLDHIRESIFYLERPEVIEERGGYLPGGILLWGPPGTGKTLLAEAVAGETGKPFVFVDPGAFIQMFVGVGALKVKALYRKLRKLSIRYGGVIVFFDEADALGNRGAVVTEGGGWRPPTSGSVWQDDPACRGLCYLSSDSVSVLHAPVHP
ncbi:MAG TPA: AAA family ATPase, partial [Actinomycetota bacterium]|nr:AAA family ATPase [Actinomycetota bacterium]